jgi:hypothetical protein
MVWWEIKRRKRRRIIEGTTAMKWTVEWRGQGTTGEEGIFYRAIFAGRFFRLSFANWEFSM